MHISWLGNTAVKIQVKPFDKDVTIVIDPYKPEKGSFPRSLTPDIGLYTKGEKDSITLSGDPFVLDTPGECETKGVLITTVQSEKAEDIKIRLDKFKRWLDESDSSSIALLSHGTFLSQITVYMLENCEHFIWEY